MAVQLRIELLLPSEARSVPLVRSVLRHTLEVLDVSRECCADIELAITEACTNVLNHVQNEDAYLVVAGIRDDICTLEIVDGGAKTTEVPIPVAGGVLIDENAEGGRGLQLMRALVDTLDFQVHPDDGTVVRMRKTLVYAS